MFPVLRRRAATLGGAAIACVLLSGTSCGPAGPGPTPDTVPDFDAATFTEPTRIDHAYFPLVPGTTWTYESQTDEGLERTVVEVLDDTREVLGVSCRVVRDRVYLDGVLIEDTHDWYAGDDAGNVWYMGEEVDNYAYDDSGALLGISHEGAWEAGADVDGIGQPARAGYVMRASPMPGDTYSQEYYAGQAEDRADVVALDVEVMLADGSSYRCLQTRDYTPLDPEAIEYKYYAPGVGLVLEEEVGGDQRAELIVQTP